MEDKLRVLVASVLLRKFAARNSVSYSVVCLS